MIVPRRKSLPHEIPLWVDPQREIYFITINCQPRWINHLAKPGVAGPLLDSVRFRNERFIWFAHLFLLMPDHVHALVSFPQPVAPLDAALRHLGEMSLPQSRVGTAGSAVPARKAGGTNVPSVAPLNAALRHLGEMSLPKVGTAGSAVPAPKAGGTNVPSVAPLNAALRHLGEMSLPKVGTAGPAVPARKAGGTNVQQIVTSWKRWTARELGIQWQRDFFEHRLRREESRREKADYILANPVRKGLAKEARDWPYVFMPNPIE